MSMTREGVIESIKVALYRAVEDPPSPGEQCRDRAMQLLDDLESYIRTRQGNALHWAAEQHQRVSAVKLRRWAGLLADGRASIQPWAEIAPILEAEKCWWCCGLIYWNAGAWHHVGGDEECCPDPHPITEEE